MYLYALRGMSATNMKNSEDTLKLAKEELGKKIWKSVMFRTKK